MSLGALSKDLYQELNKLNNDHSLVVKYFNNDSYFSHNANQQFWAASVIKIPIVLGLYKYLNVNQLNHDKKTKIAEENYVLGRGVVKLLNRENEYSIKDLVTYTLVISDNTAANQLVDIVGAEYIQNYINEIGLKNTTFKHKMMISAGRGPNLTTAEDMCKLLELMYNNKLLGSKEVLSIMEEQLDRTRIPLFIPNDVKISYRNGSLEHALHEVGIVYSNHPFIFCFFSDDQQDKKVTNKVLSTCAKLCYEYSIKSNQ